MTQQKNRFAISISGAGGAGAVTLGAILLQAMGETGFYGMMSRSSGPQIRGGESAVMLHFSDQMIEVMASHFDLHFALDWRNFDRFEDEIQLTTASQVFYDASRDAYPNLPGLVKIVENNRFALPLNTEIKAIKGARANMFALGVLGNVLGLSYSALEKALKQRLAKKGDAVLLPSLAAVKRGMALLPSAQIIQNWQATPKQPKWRLSGNEAIGLGVLKGGVQFVAAYPITPATEVVEYLAPRIEKIGGCLLIAEDEMAAINMVVGGSFGGKPAMTATSGPGFSLMTEGMGLAVASETPVLVVNVMRGGPSTGIPTKSEQTDLNQALYGLHGEAPHIVVAPFSIRDSVLTAQWSLGLAEALQTLVVLLSEQSIGQSSVIADPVENVNFELKRQLTLDTNKPVEAAPYLRYLDTETHISPMVEVGQPGDFFTADGLEHSASGYPSSRAVDHHQQLQKRANKLTQFEYGTMAFEYRKPAKSEVLLITWGGCFSACEEAVSLLSEQGLGVALLGIRLIMPLDSVKMLSFCKAKAIKQIWVVEQNASGQLFHYLLGEKAIPKSACSFALPGPLKINAGQIVRVIRGEE